MIAALGVVALAACGSPPSAETPSTLGTTERAGSQAPAIRRVIGLVEVPAAFGRSDPNGPPGQARPAPPIELAIFASPNSTKPVFTISDPKAIDAAEHGYEELSAKVYAEQNGWYEIGLREASRETGWIAPRDAGPFRAVEQLLSEQAPALTTAWDRQLFREPVKGPFQFVPGAEEVPEVAKQSPYAGFVPGPKPSGAKVLEVRRVNGERWLKIDVEDGNCEVGGPRRVASGWVPLYSSNGSLNLWFYARGC